MPSAASFIITTVVKDFSKLIITNVSQGRHCVKPKNFPQCVRTCCSLLLLRVEVVYLSILKSHYLLSYFALLFSFADQRMPLEP